MCVCLVRESVLCVSEWVFVCFVVFSHTNMHTHTYPLTHKHKHSSLHTSQHKTNIALHPHTHSLSFSRFSFTDGTPFDSHQEQAETSRNKRENRIDESPQNSVW